MLSAGFEITILKTKCVCAFLPIFALNWLTSGTSEKSSA